MNRMFDPGPKIYTHLIDRLNRRNDIKYRDHSTALDFSLKATPPVSENHEQDVLFVVPQIIDPLQEESLFPPDLLA